MRALLKKKVDPNKMKVHKIKIREKPTTIINKTDEEYDRAKFLQRYKNKGISKSSIPSIIKEIQSKTEQKDVPVVELVQEVLIPKTKKKKGIRLTLGKKKNRRRNKRNQRNKRTNN